MARELISLPPESMWKIAPKREPPMGVWTYGNKVVVKPGMKLLFISGSVPMDASGNIVGKGDLKAQMKKCIENVKLTVEAEGGTLRDVVNLKYYTKDEAELMRTGEWRVKEFPELFGKEVGDQTGTSSTAVQVVRLCDPDQLIEIDAIAAIEPK